MANLVENKKTSMPPEGQPEKPIDMEEDVEDTKPSTKKKGKPSPFTPAQSAHIDSFIPAFEMLLCQHKLHLGKSGKEHDPSMVSNWIDKTVDQIFKSPEFEGKLDMALKTPKAWKTVCCTMIMIELCTDLPVQAVNDRLKNYRNNVFVKNNRDRLIRNALATDEGTRAHSCHSESHSCIGGLPVHSSGQGAFPNGEGGGS